jgi:arylsulfatase A-like enzyme
VLVAISCSASAAERPNIVLILADDLGLHDLSGEGSTYYESPHIDSIAKKGMRFTAGYAACQVCSPSRASILTGKYPPRHGITTFIGDRAGAQWREHGRHDSHFPPGYRRHLDPSEITLAEALRDAGYATFTAGKWHLGGQNSLATHHGFEIDKQGWGPRPRFFSPWNNPHLDTPNPGESLPIRLGEETAKFIEANRDKPFFAYLAFHSVHSPIQTSRPLWQKYRDKADKIGHQGDRFAWDRRLPVRQVQDCPIYAGMIESMDDAVGIVLAKLEELGLEENTIVCFTSDNGGVSSGDAYATSNLPLRGGKGRQWEGGIRVPLYIHAPGVTSRGTTDDTRVSGIDFYPTLLELAGIEVPAGQEVDGVSLVPLLKGESIAERPLYWHYPHYGNQGGEPSSIVIEGEWKLIYYHEDGRNELYNLGEDPGEQTNVAAANAAVVKRLRTQLDQWLASVEARFPTPDSEFDPAKRDARWEQLRTEGKANLEAQHAHYLDPNFEPNPTWWGSEPPK